MILVGKTKYKYVKLIIACLLFVVLTVGTIISPFITTLFYIILLMVLPFLLAYAIYYLLIPRFRIEVTSDAFILYWVFHNGKFHYKTKVLLHEFVGCFDGVKTKTMIIVTTNGEYLFKNIEDTIDVIEQLKPYYPENAKVKDYAEALDLTKLEQYEGIFYCQFIYIVLSKLVKHVALDDELFDLYLYIKFYNDFIKGRIIPFTIYNRNYLKRLIDFMHKIELSWIPVYVENIFKAFPNNDEAFLDNFQQMVENSEMFNEFNTQIIKNAKLVLKINEENGGLMIEQLLKYTKSIALLEKLSRAKAQME